MKKSQLYKMVGAALLLGWAALFFSGSGILVWSKSPGEDQPMGQIECHYFTGTGIAERHHVFFRGLAGRSECPRFISLD